jgi:4-hydroxy-2-oxoheptanedioate aldolase
MIETAKGLAKLEEIAAVPGLTGVYVGPADLAISMGCGVADAWTNPMVFEAMSRIHAVAAAAGLVTGIHAGAGTIGNTMASHGFRMITLASESQAKQRLGPIPRPVGRAADTARHQGVSASGAAPPSRPGGR